MNLLQFLKQVENQTASMSQAELCEIIAELARREPEDDRSEFLELLKLPERKRETSAPAGMDAYRGQLCREIEEIREKLEEISAGELCLDSELNPEYDEWYNSSVDEFIFYDPQGVNGYLEAAVALVHRCIDSELFEEAYHLACDLADLNVECDGAYADFAWEPLGISDFKYHDLPALVDQQFYLDALYAAYCALSGEQRLEALLDLFQKADGEVTLSLLMQHGNEALEKLPEFLKQWAMYLAQNWGREINDLLREAAGLIEDEDFLLELARTYTDLHPQMYIWLMERHMDSGDMAKVLHLGLEALDTIPVKYQIRSRAADLAAVAAKRLGDLDQAERCWLEAFRSDTDLTRYLRLMTECRDFARYEAEAQNIYRKQFSQEHRKSSSEELNGSAGQGYSPAENRLHFTQYYGMEFFSEEFLEVLSKGMNEKEALGWSSAFMKQGIALFILLLYGARPLAPGGRAMVRTIVKHLDFSAEAYALGLDWEHVPEAETLFWQCFCQWREGISLSEAMEQKLLKKLTAWVEQRVAAIMDGNHRNYYAECAAFIAALGEAQEALGESGAKDIVMEQYRSAYSRRSAFHKELRDFGMKDTRKKRR